MIVFDVEANGLLDKATKIHCLSYTEDGKNLVTLYDYGLIKDFLLKQKGLIGHNIVRYDIPLLEKILNVKIKARLFDTLPMSWVLNCSRSKHGLESFGEDFGILKPEITDWNNLSQEDYKYRCEEDVKINFLLWKNLLDRFMFIYESKVELDRFFRYLEFKMNCAATAEQIGWRLDIGLTKKCIKTLITQHKDKIAELQSVMPMRKLMQVKTKPKVCYKQDDTLSAHGRRWFNLLDEHGLPPDYDDEVTVVKGVEQANPNSTEQVKHWLYSLGWNPCTFKFNKNKETGEEKQVPQVRKGGELTESVKLLISDNPAVGVLDGLTVIQHRLGIFQGFIDCAQDGYLSAEIDGLTNTFRFKHKKPLVNLPGIDKPWGKEIRSCLTCPSNYVLCGADMTSLEDTTKRHYMQPYDPDYVKEMSQDGFDPHLDLAKHAGDITQEEIDEYNKGNRPDIKKLRANFKSINYSATYGAGALKMSRETGMSEDKARDIIEAYWKRNWAVKVFAGDQEIRKINGEMWVQNPVSKFWHSLRKEKDTFSTINQGTGAYCFDKWVGLYRTRRPNIIGQFHDESINLVKKGEEQQHTEVLTWAIRKLNDELKLNVNLGIDIQYGDLYSQIH